MTVDVTHSSSSVDLIPTAEDEAGLSVIHSEGLTERERERDRQKNKTNRDKQGQGLVTVKRTFKC